MSRRLDAALTLLWAVAAAPPPAPASAADAIVVEDWRGQALGHRGVPDGWQRQSWGRPAYDFTVEDDAGGRRALHLKSDGDNSTVTKQIGKVDVDAYPILEWRWRVLVLPAGADSRRAATDDQAAQLYVVFPRFPTAMRSRVIGYVWDSTAPVGTTVQSPSSRVVRYIVVRCGPAGLGEWITERRDVRDDYRRIYGEAPGEAIEAVSVGIDSNDTRSRAESYVGEIAFRRR